MVDAQKTSDRCNQRSEMDNYMQNLTEEHACTNNSLLFATVTPLLKQNPLKKPRQWAAWTRQEEENFFNALRQVGKNFEKITCRVQSKNKDQESQLVKDRNKSRRKRPQGEMHTAALVLPGSSKGLGTGNNGPCPGADCPNVTKLRPKGSCKHVSMDGNGNANFRVRGTKGVPSSIKTVKQKRKGGMVKSAAYKKWEKAAMAGVSLVADAAEQLERANLNKDHSVALPDVMCSHNGAYCNKAINSGVQYFMKLKLQLFPIDEATRRALEKDSHNPHLELTLSGRKRIASVLEHLHQKWGNSDVACGELALLPYTANLDNLRSCQRWTIKDTVVTADVFASVGSPSVFRLRYGWFTDTEITSCSSSIPRSTLTRNHFLSSTNNHCVQQSVGCGMISPNVVGEISVNQENRLVCTGDMLDQEWADSLTNISVGYLLSEASRVAHLDCAESSVNKDMTRINEAARSIDSFDATIAAHLSTTNNISLFSAEETRDGFSYEAACTSSLWSQWLQKDFLGNIASNDNDRTIKDVKGDHSSDAKDLSSDDNNCNAPNDASFADIYWPDSLGPLDFDVPPIRYQGPELGFGNSLNSLTCLLASSSDAL